jgi:hypothetical protein
MIHTVDHFSRDTNQCNTEALDQLKQVISVQELEVASLSAEKEVQYIVRLCG